MAAASRAQSPVSTERVKITLGSLALAPTWGVNIVMGAQLWKPYLPNVEIEGVEATSGMPLALEDQLVSDTPGI